MFGMRKDHVNSYCISNDLCGHDVEHPLILRYHIVLDRPKIILGSIHYPS